MSLAVAYCQPLWSRPSRVRHGYCVDAIELDQMLTAAANAAPSGTASTGGR